MTNNRPDLRISDSDRTMEPQNMALIFGMENFNLFVGNVLEQAIAAATIQKFYFGPSHYRIKGIYIYIFSLILISIGRPIIESGD